MASSQPTVGGAHGGTPPPVIELIDCLYRPRRTGDAGAGALRKNVVKTHVTGLEEFALTESSFRRLGSREVQAYVHLRSDDLTLAVQKRTPEERWAYLVARAQHWTDRLLHRHPGLSLQKEEGQSSRRRVRPWSQLPRSLVFRGPAHELLDIASSVGVSSTHITKIAGRRRRQTRSQPLAWFCVRALVAIRVEMATSGMQHIEDRFVLIRASSFQDAKRRLRRQWRDYATPYLNSEGQMVSWSFEKVIDVYETGETQIDPAGTEVYSKLGKRRMRPEFVWRPASKRRDSQKAV